MIVMFILITTISLSFSLLTYYRGRGWSAVRMSSYLGLMICLGTFLFEKFFFTIMDPLVLPAAFGATFIGMSARDVMKVEHIIGASFVYTILFVELFPYLNGIGGALGFLAFLSIVTAYFLTKVFSFVGCLKIDKKR